MYTETKDGGRNETRVCAECAFAQCVLSVCVLSVRVLSVCLVRTIQRLVLAGCLDGPREAKRAAEEAILALQSSSRCTREANSTVECLEVHP